MSIVRTVSVDAAGGGGPSHGRALDYARSYKRARGQMVPTRATRLSKGRVPFRRFKEIASKRIHTFVCGQQFETTLNETTGFGGLGFSIQFGATGQGMVYAIGGGAPAAIPNGLFANATSMMAMFDSYRVKEVQLCILFSANQVGLNSTTHGLPVFYSVEDSDDINPLPNANAALGYGNCKTQQFGNTGKEGRQYCSIKAPTVPIQSNTISGSQFAVQKRSPWIDCNNPAIVHNGLKIWYASPVTSNVTAGTITWTFSVVIECKGLK